MKWDGLPEGCPKDFIEGTALFYSPGAGCKRTDALGTVIAPIRPANLTVYGRPYQWIPQVVGSTMPMPALADFYTPSNDPSLWIGASICDQIEPYVKVMNEAMAVLNQNIFALSQPIMIVGLPTANLQGLLMESEIMDGESFIQIAGKEAVQPEVLDLKAQDHTQNLISTIDWCDARILEIMMSSNGVQKSSGVSTLETVSGVQSIMQQFENGLELRRAWADECNDRFGLSMTCEPSAGIKSLMEPPKQTQEAPTEDEQDGESDD